MGIPENQMVGTSPSFLRKLAALCILVLVGHFVLGAWYATHAEGLPHRLSIWTSGEAFLSSYADWNSPHERDDAMWNRSAYETLRTGVPRDRHGVIFLYMPVYSYFAAGCYLLGGLRLLSLVAGQALLSALTCWFVGKAAFRFGGGSPLAGLAAAGLYAINLRMAMYVGMVSPTTMVLLLTAIAFLSAMRVSTARGLWGFVGAMALGTYAQSAFFVVSGAGAIWLAIEAVRRRRLLPLVGAVAIAALAAFKVQLTNQIFHNNEFGRLYTGLIYEDNNPFYERMGPWDSWERRPWNPWTTWKATTGETQRFDEYLRRARPHGEQEDPGPLWARENPVAYATLCFVRLRTNLGAYTGQMSPRNRAMSTVFWLLTFPAGAVGLWKARRRPEAAFAGLVFLAILAFCVLIFTEWYLRYRMPADLILTITAGPAWAMALGRFCRPLDSKPNPRLASDSPA